MKPFSLEKSSKTEGKEMSGWVWRDGERGQAIPALLLENI
jgi:hypothetical protein